MDLAIINISDSAVATGQFKLDPGGRVKVSAYYRSEEALAADLEVQRYVAARRLVIAPVDFDGIAQQTDRAAALDAADEAQKAAALAERIARGRRDREDRVVVQQEARVRRQAERRVKEHQQENERLNEMAALFERGRKERLQRAAQSKRPADAAAAVNRQYDERLEQLNRERAALGQAPIAPPPPEVEPAEPQPETSAGLVDTTPNTTPESDTMGLLSMHDAPTPPTHDAPTPPTEQPTLPPSDVGGAVIEPSVVDAPAETTATTATADDTTMVQTPPRDITVEDLDDAALRYALKSFEVPGRSRMKTRDAMLDAVRQLNLTAAQLAQLASDAREGGE